MSQEFHRHVGNRIRLRRALLGVSKTALGKAIGKSSSQIARYEKGEGSIIALTLQQVACQLQVPYSYFLQGIDEKVLYGSLYRKDIAKDQAE